MDNRRGKKNSVEIISRSRNGYVLIAREKTLRFQTKIKLTDVPNAVQKQ